MKASNLMATCRWFGRAALVAYLLSSASLLMYLSSQTTQYYVTGAVRKEQRSSSDFINNNIISTEPPTAPPKPDFPVPVDRFYHEMLQAAAERSSRHQQKFLARKNVIASKFSSMERFQSELDVYAAILISPGFAFLHIWKCGGTTIAALVGNKQYRLNETSVQQRDWVAFVRDPIDRFLSAWAECGFRQLQHSQEWKTMEHHTVLNWIDGEYDFRVRAFLNEVRDFTFPTPELTCHTHAHPQANYMMNARGAIDEHVKMVGDLSELKPVLEIAGIGQFPEDAKGRDANSNQIKSKEFPSRRDLLKDATILELCKFYALDYFLFDFDPPLICVQKGGPLYKFYQ